MRVLPSGLSSVVDRIVTFDGELQSVNASRSVTLTLEDEIDISRGDMLVGEDDDPLVTTEFAAMLCWMSDRRLEAGMKCLLKHTSRTTKAIVRSVDHRIDVNTFRVDSASSNLEKNDIGRVQIRTLQPVVCDAYRTNRETGAFIIIDPDNHDTLACGMIDQPRDGFAPYI